ncbi:HutD/Ves family protein [Tahibacter amnicola]|uniref:HutD family protein n=1 Tax=Tahibacter amnicola TaxID=2976241 RepID=A0ABY6BAR8_9GAMM|nr:HutD family protein [Tahibacter amnicola]UXI67158.1 HutD family protein [Tahibacter amnicola]
MSLASVRHLHPASYRRMAWKNGGGITTELVRSPADAENYDWRVSIADIAQDGDFSIFPGIDRQLMLLEGGGIELVIGTDEPTRLEQRFRKVAFPGEAPVNCYLLDGPTRDFNVMCRRGAVDAELLARTIVGPMLLFPAADTTWLLYVVNGHVQVKAPAVAAEAGDTLIVTFNDATQPVVLNGAGELVLVRFKPTPPA